MASARRRPPNSRTAARCRCSPTSTTRAGEGIGGGGRREHRAPRRHRLRRSARRRWPTSVARHGRLDAVWANAGIGIGGPVELVDPDIWTRVDPGEPHRCVQHGQGRAPRGARRPRISGDHGLARQLRARAGDVRVLGVQGRVEAFANALRTEVAHQGVTVGVLAPDLDRHRHGARGRRRIRHVPPIARIDARAAGQDLSGRDDHRPDRRRLREAATRVFLPGFVRMAHRPATGSTPADVARPAQGRARPPPQLFVEPRPSARAAGRPHSGCAGGSESGVERVDLVARTCSPTTLRLTFIDGGQLAGSSTVRSRSSMIELLDRLPPVELRVQLVDVALHHLLAASELTISA